MQCRGRAGGDKGNNCGTIAPLCIYLYYSRCTWDRVVCQHGWESLLWSSRRIRHWKIRTSLIRKCSKSKISRSRGLHNHMHRILIFPDIRLLFMPGTGYPVKYVRWVFFSSRKYQIHWSIKVFIFYFSKRIEKSNINNYVLGLLSGKSNRISGLTNVRCDLIFFILLIFGKVTLFMRNKIIFCFLINIIKVNNNC